MYNKCINTLIKIKPMVRNCPIYVFKHFHCFFKIFLSRGKLFSKQVTSLWEIDVIIDNSRDTQTKDIWLFKCNLRENGSVLCFKVIHKVGPGIKHLFIFQRSEVQNDLDTWRWTFLNLQQVVWAQFWKRPICHYPQHRKKCQNPIEV